MTIRDPNRDAQIVGFSHSKDPDKEKIISENSHM